MTRFFLLPPRLLVGEAFTRFLQRTLPGYTVSSTLVEQMLELLQTSCVEKSEMIIVFRDELPDFGLTDQVLKDGFGATGGDEVIELHLASSGGEMQARSWRLPGVSAA
jgi:hypothetical protein